MSRLPAADIGYVRHSVSRACGLRINLDSLDVDEEHELKQLIDKIRKSADVGVERSDPGVLDKDQRQRWERLVAKAASKPSDYFDVRRKQAAAAEAEAGRARRPSAQLRFEEPGCVVLPAEVWRGLQQGGLSAVQLLVLTLVLAAVENAAPVHARMRIEDGVVILPTVEALVASLDPEHDVAHVALAVRELADAGVLVVERRGEVRVSLGQVLSEALRRRTGAR